jgi:hypothetical protein
MHHRLVVTSIVLLIAAVSGLLSSLWTLQRQQTANERLAALYEELAARKLEDISHAFEHLLGQLQVGRSYAIVDAARISSQPE